MRWWRKPSVDVPPPSQPEPVVTKCPDCHNRESVIQHVIHRMSDQGPLPVGAVVRCLWCRKMYSVVDGEVKQPKWIMELETMEVERKQLAEKQREAMRERPVAMADGDLRWGNR